MSRRQLRSTSLKESLAQLNDFFSYQEMPQSLGANLLLFEVEKHYNWILCLPVEESKSRRPQLTVREENSSSNGLRSLRRKVQANRPSVSPEERPSVTPTQPMAQMGDVDFLKESDKQALFRELNSDYESESETNDLSSDENLCIRGTNEDFYAGMDIDAAIHKLAPIPRLQRNETADISRIILDPIQLMKTQKVHCRYGLYSPSSEYRKGRTGKTWHFDIPGDASGAFEDRDYELPFNIFCPELLPDYVDLSLIAGYQELWENIHEEKLLTMKGQYAVNGVPLQIDPTLDKSFKEYKRSFTRPYFKHGTEVFKTSGKGLGLRATREYHPGEFIMELTGEILTYREFLSCEPKDYCINFIDGYVINSYEKGSPARFINHLIRPNCEYRIFLTQNESGFLQPRIAIIAKNRRIECADELTFDYNENRIYDLMPKRCYCGEIACSGFIRANYSKFDLISFPLFVYYWDSSQDGDLKKILQFLQNMPSAKFSAKKLKKLSVYCLGEPKDSLDLLFYVVKQNETYYEYTKEVENQGALWEAKIQSSLTFKFSESLTKTDNDNAFDRRKTKRTRPQVKRTKLLEPASEPTELVVTSRRRHIRNEVPIDKSSLPEKLKSLLKIDMVDSNF